MPTEVILTPRFMREAKRALKKYSSLRQELSDLSDKLLLNPQTGVPLGNQCYKIRLAVRSKGQGKRGGMRVITYVLLRINATENTVYLASIYDKAERATVTDAELESIVADIVAKK